MTSLKGEVRFCFMDIDINFNFYSDTPKGKDPDSYSETLRKYHQFLWSKSLPNGSIFKLDIETPKILHHKSDLGEFFYPAILLPTIIVNGKEQKILLNKFLKTK